MTPASAFPAARRPDLSVGRTAAVCLLSLAAAIFSLETFWRSRGWTPSVSDTTALRAWHFDRALNADADSVVLMGTSRMQNGFDPEVCAARRPADAVINLSASGQIEFCVLEALADAGYSGTVISSFRAQQLSDSDIQRSESLLAEWRAAPRTARLESASLSRIQSRFVWLHASLAWPNLIDAAIVQRGLPKALPIRTRVDRHQPTDFQLLAERGELEKQRADRLQRDFGGVSPSLQAPPEWDENALRLGKAVAAIRSRGGRVVLVRFPTTGAYWEADEIRFPKVKYWDRLADLTGADTIHFKDVPALADFDCPDASHLDQRDAPRFTAALLDELERRGAF